MIRSSPSLVQAAIEGARKHNTELFLKAQREKFKTRTLSDLANIIMSYVTLTSYKLYYAHEYVGNKIVYREYTLPVKFCLWPETIREIFELHKEYMCGTLYREIELPRPGATFRPQVLMFIIDTDTFISKAKSRPIIIYQKTFTRIGDLFGHHYNALPQEDIRNYSYESDDDFSDDD